MTADSLSIMGMEDLITDSTPKSNVNVHVVVVSIPKKKQKNIEVNVFLFLLLAFIEGGAEHIVSP